MVGFESLGSTEDAGAVGSLRRFGKGLVVRLRVVSRRSKPNRSKGERVCSVILLQLVHILGKESERGRGSDIGRIVTSEFHELIVEQ